MRSQRLLPVISTFLLMLSTGPLLADSVQWPGNAKAAVSLSYDDTLNSQLDNAIPTLNKHGIKASFYLLVHTPVIRERLEEWRAVAAQGHELGNHTLFHACSRSGPDRAWVSPDNDLDKRTVQQMRAEVEVASAFLQAIDGRTERTLTPPCGDRQVADGDYVAAVRDLFVGIKSDPASYPPELPPTFATYAVPSEVSGKELIEFVQQSAEQHRLINIIFHGIGGDHLSISSEAHEQLITYLAANRDTYWTDTYLNIMTHLRQRD